jgi:hypothetical protein
MADDLGLHRDASCRKCHSEVREVRAETTLLKPARKITAQCLLRIVFQLLGSGD